MDASTDVFLYSGAFAHLIRHVEPEVLDECSRLSATWPVTYVYSLIDPRDESVRYIGCSGNPHARLLAHSYHTRRPEVRDWLRELKAIGLMPRIAILDQHRHFVMALRMEDRLIAEYHGFHGGLLNRYKRYTKRSKEDAARLACAARRYAEAAT